MHGVTGWRVETLFNKGIISLSEFGGGVCGELHMKDILAVVDE